jgi:hypothetical protein
MSEALAIAAARERLLYDTPFWAGGVTRRDDGTIHRPGPGAAFQGCAKIVNKAGELVPLIANDFQLELDAAMEGQRAAGLPMRIVLLKARQRGGSTWVEAKITQRLTQLMYKRGVVVAHEVKTAGSIFDMSNLIHSHLPTEEELGLGFHLKPAVIGASFSPNGRKFIQFGEQSRRLREQGRTGTSQLDIDTAQSPDSGRGVTRHYAHLSEVAKWPERATQGTQSKMISVLNSVPWLPETIVVLESTANGLNHFYRRWVSARDGIGDPDSGETYIPIFAPWWRDSEYQMPFSSPEERERFEESIGTGPYGDDEPMLVEVHGCTAEQLRWRRMQIRTQHEDNVELFKQEYPASDEEAFIGSGNPVFPGVLVGRAIKAVESAPEPVKGTLREAETVTRKTRGGTIEIPTRVLWVPEDECARDEPLLSVWEHPRGGEQVDVDDDMDLRLLPPAAVAAEKQQREAALREALERGPGQYVVAADIAEGESNTFTSGDFHAVHVLDHVTKTQVAEYESHLDLHLLPRWIFLIALYYNEAILGVERNGPGVAVVEPLKNDLRYRRLYKQRKVDQQQSHKFREKIGWTTDQVTKPELEVTFAQALQEETHGLRSIRCARQLNTYVEDDRGRHGAQAGEHDDLLMAAMIARRIAVLMQPRRPKSGRRWVPDDELTGY